MRLQAYGSSEKQPVQAEKYKDIGEFYEKGFVFWVAVRCFPAGFGLYQHKSNYKHSSPYVYQQ